MLSRRRSRVSEARGRKESSMTRDNRLKDVISLDTNRNPCRSSVCLTMRCACMEPVRDRPFAPCAVHVRHMLHHSSNRYRRFSPYSLAIRRRIRNPIAGKYVRQSEVAFHRTNRVRITHGPRTSASRPRIEFESPHRTIRWCLRS